MGLWSGAVALLGNSSDHQASFVTRTDIASQACKSDDTVLWGTVHLQSYLKG